jgi:hypothetical protein
MEARKLRQVAQAMKSQWTDEEIALHDKYRPVRELCRPAECKGGASCWVAQGIRGLDSSVSRGSRCRGCNSTLDMCTTRFDDSAVCALRGEIAAR